MPLAVHLTRLPFSLSMGCGSWGENSITITNWTHFVNRVRIARPIPPVEPTIEDIFADDEQANRLAYTASGAANMPLLSSAASATPDAIG